MSPAEEHARLDRSLADRLQRDDPSVLEDVFNRVVPPIRRRLRSRFDALLQEADWDDVMSTALFRLWAMRHRFDPAKGTLATWLYLIARSAAWDHLRKRPKMKVRSSDKLAEIVAESPEVEHSPQTDDMRRLVAALDHLADVDRHILLGFAARAGEKDWTSPIVAELGMPASTIRVRKHRALAELRELLCGADAPFPTVDNAMKLSELPPQYDDFVRHRWDQIETVAGKLRTFQEQRTRMQERGGLAQVEAEWNAALEEPDKMSQTNREGLEQTYAWLIGLATPSAAHRDKLRRFVKSLPSSQQDASIDEQVGDLEQAFSMVTTKIELRMPDYACREGEGHLQLAYPDDDVSLHWVGDSDESPLMLKTLVKSALASDSCFQGENGEAVAGLLVKRINAAEEIPLPNFSFPEGANAPPPTLDWRRAQPAKEVVPSREELPDWMREGAAAPTDAEMELFRVDAELAEALEKLAVEAALADWKHRDPATSEAEEADIARMGAVESLVDAIEHASGLPKSEVAAFIGPRLLERQERVDSAGECAANTNALARLWAEISG